MIKGKKRKAFTKKRRAPSKKMTVRGHYKRALRGARQQQHRVIRQIERMGNMYGNGNSGLWGVLKLAMVLGFIIVAVRWLQGGIGQEYATLAIFALIGVLIFGGGLLAAHIIQKQTLAAVTSFAQKDAQTDRYRQQSFTALARGDAAMQKAAAQLTVLDARRVDQLAQGRTKLLVDNQRSQWEIEQQQQQPDLYDIDNDVDAYGGWS